MGIPRIFWEFPGFIFGNSRDLFLGIPGIFGNKRDFGNSRDFFGIPGIFGDSQDLGNARISGILGMPGFWEFLEIREFPGFENTRIWEFPGC